MNNNLFASKFLFAIGIVLFLPQFALAQKTPVSEMFKAWEGTWERIDKSENQFETWEVAGKTQLKGKAIKIISQDTTLLETLEILQKGKKIYYLATVIGQNQGKSIPFLLTQQQDKIFRFENQKHEYPQVIEYTFLSDTEFSVQVGALESGQITKSFGMKFQQTQ